MYKGGDDDIVHVANEEMEQDGNNSDSEESDVEVRLVLDRVATYVYAF